MKAYPVVYERADDGGWGAYAPDLPGLGVVGDTQEEVRQLIRDGIRLHIDSLREHNDPVPEPFTSTELIEVV
jgi:predicted RNase H-like HicB family nuclease